MAHMIASVERGSIAEGLGILAGDELVSINGEPVVDFLDYQALTAEAKMAVVLRRGDEETEFVFEKDEYEPLGLEFSRPMMSATRLCLNKCVFCFVDQLPGHARDSLRVKDDDWRMSLMMGNYVTLTNVSDRELERIVKRHASPIYISVHSMDPALRSHILGTPRGARLPKQLERLKEGGIEFHAQAVLCPGLNDGPALEETIERLVRLTPAAKSLALVPVGLTSYREGLSEIRKYTRDEARAVLEIAEKWRKRLFQEIGTRFVFPSDEFYLQAEISLPSDEEYEDYGQIDDGVGMLRLLETEFLEAYQELPARLKGIAPGRKIAIACGVSAADFLKKLVREHPVAGAEVRVQAIENHFFGPSVTVSGLLTGSDLIRGMGGEDCERILITECMLRDGENLFLDDRSLEEVSGELGRPVIPVGRRGDELLQAILENRSIEAPLSR